VKLITYTDNEPVLGLFDTQSVNETVNIHSINREIMNNELDKVFIVHFKEIPQPLSPAGA
jgi:hypothetical protein